MSTTTAIQWKIDAAHSEIQFKVRHMMVSTVTGFFREFDATVESTTDNFQGARISFAAQTASLDTNNAQRDGHLRSPDFFDAETYPEISFKSSSLEHIAGDNYKLVGDLTLHGVTKPVALDVAYFGAMTDPYGNQKAGFELNGEVNRTDFGLKWNTALETGGVMVSEKVRLHANVQLQKG
ncbi:MAG: YceI family protein [Bacteroidota bacterium]